jgi:aminopeptidase YwaD
MLTKRLGPWIPAALAFSLVSAGLAAEKPLASPDLARALADEVSGEIAYRYTNLISGYDRVQASEGWRAAAEMIRQELVRLGYDDAVIEGWPSDGTRRYYTYRSVIGWRARKAELWMLSPTRERLCSYEEVPLTLVKHSGPGNVETELVDVGTGIGEASYRGRDIKGKIVLATGATAEVMRQAVVERGAAGVLTYFPPDTRPGYPNMIRYTALWPRWEERERLGFAFNISKNQGATLKRLLEEGRKVVLKAEVDAEFYKTDIETLTASFPGAVEPDKEILLVAHLCHPTPSANDNASGSGGLLEMARALRRMVDSGAVAPPRRTIRFLWVPEFNGLVPYIQAHLERTRNTLAAVNCDMIGEDLHKTGGVFNIFRTPDSRPTFLNDVVANFAGLAESLGLVSLNGSRHPFVWRSVPYGGGSDHVVFNDGSLRVPSVMLNRGDIFHHTSLDTMDKVDPTELRRAVFLALGSVYYLASAMEREALDMARLIVRNGHGRFTADLYDGFNGLYGASTMDELHAAYKQALNIIAHSGRRERAAVLSTLAFGGDKAVEREIAALNSPFESAMLSYPKEAAAIYRAQCAKLGGAPKPLAISETERLLTRLIPVRSEDFVAPLQTDYLVEKLGPGVLDELKLRGNFAYEALNLADGKRTLHDIFLAVSAQFGPFDPAHVESFFRVLEKAGLAAIREN